ncbi:hypothetical protein ABAC460_03660 [Asticcacaulis sp. AC460]|uniref:hypothetical protein n=1 Tax=Asticcacaulis sp. AC460 TaxID=1282360 RepID=UPI0003C3CD4F|nr:hypothetical protein [Asticcacaulis sp. AC460]ESQ92006.1 hypothetical protein ABAC460_03660 [Asticcacaulis sp. AC460]
MRQIWIACVLLLSLGVTVQASEVFAYPQTYVTIEKPANGTPVLVVRPEVSLGMITAAGAYERRDDWSENATQYLNEAATTALTAKSYTTQSAELTQFEDAHDLQLLKLNSVVVDTIAMNEVPLFALPTKTTFDWTLGEGAAALAPDDGDVKPAYVLFVQAQGTYSSGGRAALAVGMMALGVGVPMGGQVVSASLVDLTSGRVVWYGTYAVAPGTDIRTAEGAKTAIKQLFFKFPL